MVPGGVSWHLGLLSFSFSVREQPAVSPLQDLVPEEEDQIQACNEGKFKQSNSRKWFIQQIQKFQENIPTLGFHQSQTLLFRKNAIQDPRKTHTGLRQQFLNNPLLLDDPGIFRRVQLEVILSSFGLI
jgi:hypothetical protein